MLNVKKMHPVQRTQCVLHLNTRIPMNCFPTTFANPPVMKKLLILLFWLGTMVHAFAQTPENISLLYPVKPDLSAHQAEFPCNFAGSFTLGTFFGQSNDSNLDTIYLCYGDSIFIDHNGDYDVSNAPNPATAAGIAWAFYDCPPVIAGDNLQAILGDPCLTNDPVPQNGIWLARGNIDGDIMFRNLGLAQDSFGNGQSVILHFAPITVDNWDSLRYESSQPGFPQGPCVNVNTAVQFAVAYLNPIDTAGVSNNWLGDDCLGKFKIGGGLPNLFDETYDIEIFLASNPEVNALQHLPPQQLKDDANLIFSVSQPGIYTVTVEDGKSCGLTFQIDMSGCDASDNVTFIFPDTVAPPGSQICIPVTAENYIDIFTANINIGWDPTVFQYTGFQNPNPAIGTFTGNDNIGDAFAALGLLSLTVFNQDVLGQTITIPDGEAIVELCFDVIGTLGQCSPFYIPSGPGVVNVEDLNGVSQAVTVDTGQICVDFLPLNVAVTLQDTICNGASSSATLSVTALGGIEPFEVNWRMILPTVGPTITGFIPVSGGTYFSAPGAISNGTYVVILTDQNGIGDVIRDTIQVSFPTLGASLDLTLTPLCFGDKNGEVRANVLVNGTPVPNPGAPQYQFAWSGPDVVQGTALQTGLGAGMYNVTVTETTTGCLATASGTLGQPTLVRNDDLQITEASCSGLPDGSITYTVAGGTPFAGGLYSFNWEYSANGFDPPVQSDAGVINPFFLVNKPAGTYYVTFTDANGCSATDEVVLGNAREVELMLTETRTSCAGSSDGAIQAEIMVTPSDPNDAFFFFFLPAGGTQDCPTPLSCTYSGLPAGTYNVVAIDAIGCVDTASIVVTSPQPLTLDTLGYSEPNCKLQNNGTISVIAFGGTGSPLTYNYTWDDSAMGPNRTGLVPGMYSVTVTDLNGCQDSLAFDLQLPSPPAITAVDSTAVKCGSDGCLSVTVDTSEMLFYTWTLVDGTFIDTTAGICNLMGGTYIVNVSDNQGCETIDTFTLAAVDTLFFADTTFLQPTCFGYPDGRIGVTVGGGTPNYSYQWTPTGQISPTLFDVEAGSYTLSVTDANNCVLSGTFTLVDPPAIVSLYTQVDASCANICDGQAIVEVAYSDGGSGDFDFIWCDGSTDSTRIDLCPGDCAVTIVDGNNCFVIDAITVGSPDIIDFSSFVATPASCFGLADGSITIVPTGGNGTPYTFLWSVNNATTPTLDSVPKGDYTVTVTDLNGCTAEFTELVTEPEELMVNQDLVNTSLPICFGDDNGQLGVLANGGNPGPYTYAWSDSGGVSLGATPVISDIPAGSYSVTVTDVNGCTGTLPNLILNDPPPVIGSYLPWMELTCNGDETTLFIDAIIGGAGSPYQYSLDFGVLLDASFPIAMDGGTHYITYYDRLNCEITDTIFVFEPDPLVVAFDSTVIEIELGDTLTTLQPIITGALVDTFFWDPAALLTNPGSLTPMINTFTTTTYTLTVFDANGCSGTGSITVDVDPNRNIYIPNVFHPGNTSGLNDRFNVYAGLGVEIVSFFQIFDRWGGLMYERTDFFPSSFDFGEGWDGRYNGDYVNPGVYVYVTEVKFLDGRILTYRGDITVVR